MEGQRKVMKGHERARESGVHRVDLGGRAAAGAVRVVADGRVEDRADLGEWVEQRELGAARGGRAGGGRRAVELAEEQLQQRGDRQRSERVGRRRARRRQYG